jgi:hypothetical protein
MDFNNCHFVQFTINDGLVVPLKDHPFVYKTSTRIPTADPFLTLPSPSKSGFKIKTPATHWGIFDMSNDQPECLVYQPFTRHSSFRHELRENHLLVVIKGDYFTVRITKHKTIYAMIAAQTKG